MACRGNAFAVCACNRIDGNRQHVNKAIINNFRFMSLFVFGSYFADKTKFISGIVELNQSSIGSNKQ